MIFLAATAMSLALLSVASAAPYSETAFGKALGSLEPRVRLSQAEVASQFNFLPWEFRNICVDCQRNTTDVAYSCKTKFEWCDPNSVAENNVTSGRCSSDSWGWDGTEVSKGGKASLPTTNQVCHRESAQNYFQFKFTRFNTAENFTLQLEHRYKDDQNFTAPWDHPSIFTTPTFNLTAIKNTKLAINYFSAGVQYAKVQGISN